MRQQTLTIIVRILEECLEEDYAAEELRAKIRDVLRLIGKPNAPLTSPAQPSSDSMLST